MKIKVIRCLPLVRAFLTAFVCSAWGVSSHAQPLLNEIMASNAITIADEYGEFDDWIELYNPGSDTIQLAGYFISDKLNQPFKHQIPFTDSVATQLLPHSYLLLWADGQIAQGPLHLSFKLDASGEALVLSGPDSTLIEEVVFGSLSTGQVYARFPNGTGAWSGTLLPSPYWPNSIGPIAPVLADPPTGRYTSPFEVHLSCATPLVNIHYTLDGSEPDTADAVYQGPLSITGHTVLRARAFAPDRFPGEVVTRHYVFDTSSFPVVLMGFNPAHFFDSITGIYVNYPTLQELERPVHIAFLEPDGTVGFSGEVLVELHGSASLGNPQKSLLIKTVAGAHFPLIDYPVFPDLPYRDFTRLILRNSGQDWNITMFRDAFIAALAEDRMDLKPVLDSVFLDFQAYRPALVYFNGQLQGIHNIREQMRGEWVRHRYGATNVDLIEQFSTAVEGDSIQWMALLQWLYAHPEATQEALDSLNAQMDMLNFADYTLFQIITDNVDWPIKNWRRFKAQSPGAKWIWLPYDFDLSYGLLTQQGWNTGFAGQNAILRALDSVFMYPSSPDWSTLPLRRALAHPSYRHYWLNRMADLLNTVFLEERVKARLDSFKALYSPEILKHFIRWGGDSTILAYWENNIALMGHFGQERPEQVRAHAVSIFNEDTDGVASVELGVDPPGAGQIFWSTLHFPPERLPWSGRYFTEIPIPVRATPMPGYRFSHWSPQLLSDTISLSGDISLIAHFELDTVVAARDQKREQWLTFFPNPARERVFWQSKYPIQTIDLLYPTGVWKRVAQPNGRAAGEIFMGDEEPGIYTLRFYGMQGEVYWGRWCRM